MPYLLNRKILTIDYLIISHFDSDHIGGLLTVMKELKVRNVIICMQGEESDNLKKFNEIVKTKRIKTIIVEKGDRLTIENDLYIDVFWPNNSSFIRENVLNNNSIVCKLYYKKFSMLFTGDIEKLAEEQILQEYRNDSQILKSDILKIAHHGSKTSSTEEFLKVISPKIALIGVGKDNKFGHPNKEVIDRLQKKGTKIFRTDENGEVSLFINKRGKIVKIKEYIK